MTRPIFVLSVAAALVCALRADARACSVAAPRLHVVDPSMQAADQTAPTLPPLTVQQIRRGKGPEGCSRGTCDGNGSIDFTTPATDDVTAPTSIGYRFTLEAGSLPQGFTLPTEALEPSGDTIYLLWADGATDDQDSLDFTLRVVAIDLAGNESAPQSVRVFDDRGGCAVARAGSGHPVQGWIVLMLLVAVAVRRRQSRATSRP